MKHWDANNPLCHMAKLRIEAMRPLMGPLADTHLAALDEMIHLLDKQITEMINIGGPGCIICSRVFMLGRKGR